MSQLVRQIKTGVLCDSGLRVETGQGLSEEDWHTLRTEISRHGATDRVELRPAYNDLTGRAEVHNTRRP